jgi:hypothetical protein
MANITFCGYYSVAEKQQDAATFARFLYFSVFGAVSDVSIACLQDEQHIQKKFQENP